MRSVGVFFSLILIALFLTGCPDFLGGSAVVDSSGQPVLTTGDFPEVSPCSKRDILPSDATFLETITEATEVIHIHKKYVNDANLPAVCGLADTDNLLEFGEIGWDPSATSEKEVNVCNAFDEELSEFIVSSNFDPIICRSSFGYESEEIAVGFPRSGTYRIDFCVGSGRKFYNIRIRAKISGKDVNKSLEQAGIDETGIGTEDTLGIFDKEGNELTTSEDIKLFFTEFPLGTTFTIRSGTAVQKTHMTVAVQIICVRSVDFCPIPDESCGES